MATVKDGSEKRIGDIRIRSRNGIPIVEETYGWIVIADNVYEPKESIATAAGLPFIGTTSPSGLTVCKTLRGTRREGNSLYYDFQADYSSEITELTTDDTGGGADPTDTDPTAWIPVYKTKFERLQEVVAEDASGNPVVNSAGQPYETGLTRSRFIPIWHFYQFEAATVTDETIIDRNETVNETEFKGRAISTLLLTVEDSEIGYFYGARRRLTRYALRYNKKTWKRKRLDVGTTYLDGATLKTYVDDDGNPILGPLDGAGGKVSPINTGPAINEFDEYALLEFKDFLRV